MINSPLVSIVLPTYNRAKWLPKSIGSVIAQTYQNWELIVWDDGSTDDSSQVIMSFGDERICYFREENNGVAYARNHAIRKAKGSLIAFLDSDDEWMTGKLSRQVKILNKFAQIDFLFGDYENINMVTRSSISGFDQSAIARKNLMVKEIEDNLFEIQGGMPESLFISNFIATDTVMIRRKLLDSCGSFIEDLRSGEDIEYWCRLGLNGTVFGYVEEKLIARFKPADSLSSPSIENYKSMVRALDYCYVGALKHNNQKLLKRLKKSYLGAWLSLSNQHLIQGNNLAAFKAYLKSLNYGMSIGSFNFIFKAIFGIKNIYLIQNFIRNDRS